MRGVDHFHSGSAELHAAGEVEVILGAGGAFGRAVRGDLGGGVDEVVFAGAETPHAVEDGDADLFAGDERLRQILHQSLEPRGFFELGARGVGELGVYELGDHAAGGFQHAEVGLEADDEEVDVAGEAREAVRLRDIAGGVHRLAQERVEVVVFDIEREVGRAGFLEPRDAAHRLAGNAVHGDRVEVIAANFGNPERGERGVEDLAVRVLDEKKMANARSGEFFRRAARVEERVDVAVAMGFQVQVVFFLQRKMGVDVGEGGNEFLVENRDLAGREAEILVRLERGDRAGIRLAAGHDHERDLAAEALRGGANDARVVGEVGGGLGDFHGDIELDAVVAEAFAKSSRDEHDGSLGERFQADAFGFLIGRAEAREIDEIGFLRRVAREGISARGGLGEEAAGVADVGHEAAGVGAVAILEGLEKCALLVVVCAGGVPIGEKLGLVLGEEGFGERQILGGKNSGGEVVGEEGWSGHGGF